MTRRLVSGLSAIALVVTTLVVAGPTASAGGGGNDGDRREREELSGVGSVTWGACTDPTLIDFGAECGMLDVPLDYSRPRGATIEIAVSRIKHTVPEEEYRGIMLVNPGGPGGSGLIYSILGLFVPGGVGEYYDWIGFDPRGVGSSVPSLSCIADYSAGPRPQYDPVSRDVERAWLNKVADYAKACGRNGGKLLDNVKTVDNVRDMNAIRKALGEKQLNFYGFSYGTYLGQVFATLYPHRVGKMVLDSNVDPTRIWYGANIDQDYAFEAVFQVFFDWIARHNDVYGLGATADEVEANYYAAYDSLAAAPQGILGSAEWLDALIPAGYAQSLWPDLASAFSAFVVGGDPGPMSEAYLGAVDTENDNSYAMYLATECTEGRWPQRWSTWQRDMTRVDRDAPLFTWGNAWFNAPCAFWKARSSNPVNVNGSKAPPILLVSETGDAATPFSGSLEVRRRFKKAVLIASPGTTHANSLFGNACVDDQIAAYLFDGTLPARVRGQGPDATCEGFPEPEPFVADAANARVAADQLVAARSLLQAGLPGR